MSEIKLKSYLLYFALNGTIYGFFYPEEGVHLTCIPGLVAPKCPLYLCHTQMTRGTHAQGYTVVDTHRYCVTCGMIPSGPE